ncbi:transposase, partial [Adlercreutzia sp. ZJ138]|uniref:transposase n=1 Tax=Adlercreutzia sp. ZJ138 TaxID=2709405 RepID=UPI00197FCE6C
MCAAGVFGARTSAAQPGRGDAYRYSQPGLGKPGPGGLCLLTKLGTYEFHVAKLVTEAVDDVRRRLTRTIEDDIDHKEQRRILRKAAK